MVDHVDRAGRLPSDYASQLGFHTVYQLLELSSDCVPQLDVYQPPTLFLELTKGGEIRLNYDCEDHPGTLVDLEELITELEFVAEQGGYLSYSLTEASKQCRARTSGAVPPLFQAIMKRHPTAEMIIAIVDRAHFSLLTEWECVQVACPRQ